MASMVISLSEFKAKASKMLEQIRREQRPIVLTQHGSATAVVQDYDSFHRTQNALFMLKLMVQGEADIKEGRLTAQREVFSSLRKDLNERDG